MMSFSSLLARAPVLKPINIGDVRVRMRCRLRQRESLYTFQVRYVTMGGRDNGMGVRVNMRQEQGEYAYDDFMIDDR